MAEASINPMSASSDLTARFARGEPAALAEVVALHGPRVSQLAYRLLGYGGHLDDVVQDVFVAALEGRGRYRGDSSLETWLTAITLNRCRAHGRRQRLRRLGVWWKSSTPSVGRSDEPAIEQETALKVRQAVAALPRRDRELIVLSYFEGMSLEAMGAVLGRKPSTVAVQLHRAREKLRGALAEI